MELRVEQVGADELVDKVRSAFAEEMQKFIDANKPKEQEIYVSRNEAAKMLSVSLPTLSRYVELGYLQAYKLGSRTIKFKKSDIENAFAEIQLKKFKWVR